MVVRQTFTRRVTLLFEPRRERERSSQWNRSADPNTKISGYTLLNARVEWNDIAWVPGPRAAT